MNSKRIQFRESEIHYQVAGNGKPVMLLHGFAEDGRIWKQMAARLAETYTVIVPDIPGSGQSGMLADEHAGMDGYAEAINAVLLAEKIEKVVIIGHSMGGYIALAFAEKYPEKLNALGLFHSSAYADDAAKVETRQKAIEFIKQNGAAAFLKTSIPGLFADTEKSKQHIDILLGQGKTFTDAALMQYYESMIARPDRTAVLKQLDKPIFFLMGEHDKAVPFQHSLEQSHIPSLAHIHILRNSAHMGMLEESADSFDAVAHFLQTVYVLIIKADSIFE